MKLIKNIKSVCFAACYVLLSIFIAGCDKKKEPEKIIETSTVTDVQGNVYKTVKIGEQWWMAENLRVKVYTDGTAIEEINFAGTDSVWENTQIGSYCNIDSLFDARGYGLHYNWFVINDSKKIAPQGWHIPSDEEWKTLEKNIGMTQTECDKTGWRGYKESEKMIPVPPNNGWPTASLAYGNNESGFSALPGGCRLFNGTIGEVQYAGYWWSSSPKNSSTAYYRSIAADHKTVFRYYVDKNYGLTIRCVKD